MSRLPFRFLHAGDLHLEVPLHGIAEVPDQLRELLLEANYTAAGRVFDTAINEEVDFVVLAGDVVHAETAGLRALVFLSEQFRRLEARGIDVYWCGGRVDPPDAWPDAVALPENVHRFGEADVQEFKCRRNDVPVARIAGIARRKSRKLPIQKFPKRGTGAFTIGVAHANVEAHQLEAQPLDYWALGGHHSRTDLSTKHTIAHYSGSPQGRNPHETGPHGCLVVDVDLEHRPRVHFHATDAVRWHQERLILEPETTSTSLDEMIAARIDALRDAARPVDTLVQWTLAGSGRLLAELGRGDHGRSLVDSLRRRYGGETPSVWTAAMEVEPSETVLSAHVERDSILGDLLRLIHEHQVDPERAIDLEPCFKDHATNETIAALLDMQEPSVRRKVLRDAAAVGVEMLDAEDTRR